MALAGWDNNKKLTLTIDSSKIDEDLTDFPVLVTLSSGTGQNVFDATAVFDEFSYSGSLNDDFTGTNGDLPYDKRWDRRGTIGAGTIQNNKLRSLIGAAESNRNYSYHYLTGDFDIQVDWSCPVTPATTTMYTYLAAWDFGTPLNYYYLYLVYGGAGWRLWSQSYDGTTWRVEADTAITSADRKLRIVRSGTSWSTYYDTGGGWTLHATSGYLSNTNEVRHGFSAQSSVNYPTFTIDWDNYTVTSDGINYYNYDGSRKIAITDASDNQLYTEIERWEKDDNLAELWVKVPTIVSGTDTNLYLYYDNTQDDNVHYVGGVGDLDYRLAVDIGDEGTYDTTGAIGCSVLKDGSTYKMWYGGRDGTNDRIIYTTSTDGVTWTGHTMVLDKATEGDYDDTNVNYPSVIKDGSTYKMWYSGYGSTPEYPNGWRILYATSTNGTTWTNHQMVIDLGPGGGYYDAHLYAPSVIKDGSTYKMWFTGHDGADSRVMYATSTNGTTWTGHTMVVDTGDGGIWDTRNAGEPSVIKGDDGIYRMWYGSRSTLDTAHRRTMYTESSDGINWSKNQLVLNYNAEGTYDVTHAYYPNVIEDNGSYKMWYTGYDSTNYRIIYSPYWSTNVWDGSYSAVYHMNQNPNGDGVDAIKDSTPKVNHGTPAGTMLTEDLVDGKIGKGIDFDGGDDVINYGTGVGLRITSNLTLEVIAKQDILAASQRIMGKTDNTSNANSYGMSYWGNNISFMISQNGTATYAVSASAVNTEFNYAAGVYDGSNSSLYLAGALADGPDSTAASIYDSTSTPFMAAIWTNDAGYFDGTIDEIRISSTDRSSAWIKATYYSSWNNLLNFGEGAALGQIVVNDEWKSISTVQVVIGNVWKDVSEIQIVKDGVWKLLTS